MTRKGEGAGPGGRDSIQDVRGVEPLFNQEVGDQSPSVFVQQLCPDADFVSSLQVFWA